jgi:hypothetical protein
MTDALSLLHACRDAPKDFTLLLIAADFFDSSDEGDWPKFARALRYMAEHKVAPYKTLFHDGYPWRWPGHTLVPASIRDHAYVAYTAAILDLANNIPSP